MAKQKESSGFCKYCKQARIIKAPDNATQEELDQIATDECECDKASYQRKRKMQFEACECYVRNTFEDNELAYNAVIATVKAIFERQKISNASFRIGKYSYKIDMDNDNCIRIKKTFKDEDEEVF